MADPARSSRLPPWFTPGSAADRATIWRLGAIEHARAVKRCREAPQIYTGPTRGPCETLSWLIWASEVHMYPGRFRAIAALLGVSIRHARSLISGERELQPHHAAKLIEFAETIRSQADRIIAECQPALTRPRAKRGFEVVKVRDASGIPRDGRVRGPRAKPQP